jgi:uncharacterized membrane protein
MWVIYLQYASDPVTFFEYRSLYREPDWMLPPRGPDVSPRLRWYPIVTLLQLTLDMLMATQRRSATAMSTPQRTTSRHGSRQRLFATGPRKRSGG